MKFKKLPLIHALLSDSNSNNTQEKKGNYHTHTTLSDGLYDPEEIINMAINAGLDEIGITDHYFTLKGNINFVDDHQIDEYVQTIQELKQKYAGKIRVLAGLEIDTSCFNPKRSNLPFDKLNKLDYVLFEYVEDQQMGEVSKKQTIQTFLQEKYEQITSIFIKQQGLDQESASQKAIMYIEKNEHIQKQVQTLKNRRGVYSLKELVGIRDKLTCAVGLAHPDIKRNFKRLKPEELAKALKENDIFLDACATPRNSTSSRYSTYREKWSFTPYFCGMGPYREAFRKFKVEFAPSTDTHDENNVGEVDKAEAKIKQYGFVKKTF
jgi:hypothetical protein